MMPHSIRGRVDDDNEGPRYCVACHLTTQAMTDWGPEYADFRDALAIGDYASLDYPLLAQHIGANPGNQENSPFWVHMVAGLGTGLFLFDEDGCAVNPIDTNPDRFGCDGTAPADTPFDPTSVAYDIDRIVNPDGTSVGSNNHPLLEPGVGPNLRDGAADPNLSGPLGATLIEALTDPLTGIILDSWIDADGNLGGDASNFIEE